MRVHLTDAAQFCNMNITHSSSYLGTKESLQETAKLLLQESDCLANVPNSQKSVSDCDVLDEKSLAFFSSKWNPASQR